MRPPRLYPDDLYVISAIVLFAALVWFVTRFY